MWPVSVVTPINDLPVCMMFYSITVEAMLRYVTSSKGNMGRDQIEMSASCKSAKCLVRILQYYESCHVSILNHAWVDYVKIDLQFMSEINAEHEMFHAIESEIRVTSHPASHL